jgi:hypothetical protein
MFDGPSGSANSVMFVSCQGSQTQGQDEAFCMMTWEYRSTVKLIRRTDTSG